MPFVGIGAGIIGMFEILGTFLMAFLTDFGAWFLGFLVIGWMTGLIRGGGFSRRFRSRRRSPRRRRSSARVYRSRPRRRRRSRR